MDPWGSLVGVLEQESLQNAHTYLGEWLSRYKDFAPENYIRLLNFASKYPSKLKNLLEKIESVDDLRYHEIDLLEDNVPENDRDDVEIWLMELMNMYTNGDDVLNVLRFMLREATHIVCVTTLVLFLCEVIVK